MLFIFLRTLTFLRTRFWRTAFERVTYFTIVGHHSEVMVANTMFYIYRLTEQHSLLSLILQYLYLLIEYVSID